MIIAGIVIVSAWALFLAIAFWPLPRGFDSAVPHKGGHNDLSRWEAFGGMLKRPAPPHAFGRFRA